MLTAIIEQMEYQGLLKDANAQADEQMLAILVRYLQMVLASASCARTKENPMKAWRVVLLTLSFLCWAVVWWPSMSRCRATRPRPRPARQVEQQGRLGRAAETDHQPQRRRCLQGGGDRQGKAPEEYVFTVSRHGNRWYLSAVCPSGWAATS
jgi:hypothetical protein